MFTCNRVFSISRSMVARLALLSVAGCLVVLNSSAATLTVTDDNGSKAPLEIQAGDYVRVTTNSNGDIYLDLIGFSITINDGASSDTGGTGGGSGTSGSGTNTTGTGSSSGDSSGSSGDSSSSGGGSSGQAILAAQAVVPALRVEREQRFPPMDTVRVTTPAPPIAQWTKILIRGLRARVRSLTGSEVA